MEKELTPEVAVECVDIVQYCLRQLNMGKRESVPVHQLTSIGTLLLQLNKKFGPSNFSSFDRHIFNDVMLAIDEMKKSTFVNVPQETREVAIESLVQLRKSISTKAYSLLEKADAVEVTDYKVKVYRQIVADKLDCTVALE